MNIEESVFNPRASFAMLRWAPLVAAANLPFTFVHGMIPPTLALGAVPIAAVWLMSQLLAWRTRNQLWFATGLVASFLGVNLLGVLRPAVPTSQAIQWLCLVVILSGAPLLFFRARLLRFARLDAEKEAIGPRC